ncbi:tripartite tricarboxylate transporter TctB family protein [Modicisalibacter radicis]
MIKRRVNANVLVALCMLAIGIFLSIVAWSGPGSSMAVPRATLSLWCFIALLITINELRRNIRIDSAMPVKVKMLMITVLVASLVIYYVGFLIVSAIIVPVILWLFKVRSPLHIALGTLLVGTGIWFVFHHVLLIRLPTLLESGVF